VSTRHEAAARIADGMRDAIASAVLTNERIARGIGMNVVDLQTLGVMMRQGRDLTPTEVSALTALPTSTVTRVLGRLEDAGLVRRAADPDDRRRVVISVVAGALESRFEANPYADIVAALDAHNAAFTDAELETVARWLEGLGGVR
jgi:DNA-binding MarR family transcriptional regulator